MFQKFQKRLKLQKLQDTVKATQVVLCLVSCPERKGLAVSIALSREWVIEMTVDARVDEQQILNVFHYRSVEPPPGAGGDSIVFLESFIAAYRSLMLSFMYDRYTVHAYWLRIIRGAQLVSGRPRNVYSIAYERRAGDALDVGDNASGVLQFLPTNACLRAYKQPEDRWRNFAKACYNRFAPFTENEFGAEDYEQWNAAFILAMDANLTAFNAEILFGFDPPAGNGWHLCCWSPAYFARVLFPADPLATPRNAATEVFTYSADPFIGTQTTRRYNPAGGFRGK